MTNINYTLKYFGVCHAGNKINSDFAFVYIIKDMSKRFKDVNIHAVSLDSFFLYRKLTLKADEKISTFLDIIV